MRRLALFAALCLLGCDVAVSHAPSRALGGGGGLPSCADALEAAIAQLDDRGAREPLTGLAELLDARAAGGSLSAITQTRRDFGALVERLDQRGALAAGTAERLSALADCVAGL